MLTFMQRVVDFRWIGGIILLFTAKFGFAQETQSSSFMVGGTDGYFVAIIGVLVIFVVVAFGFAVRQWQREKEEAKLSAALKAEKAARISPEERAAMDAKQALAEAAKFEVICGKLNIAMICPHCQTKGTVRIKKVNIEKGISGGKATAAIVTAGLSIIATGLSRHEEVTRAYCDNCQNDWYF